MYFDNDAVYHHDHYNFNHYDYTRRAASILRVFS